MGIVLQTIQGEGMYDGRELFFALCHMLESCITHVWNVSEDVSRVH